MASSYKWSIAGYSVEQRKAAFVGDWAFFLGFGLISKCFGVKLSVFVVAGAPLTLLSSYLPFFVSYGIFALIFPLVLLRCLRLFLFQRAFFLSLFCWPLRPNRPALLLDNWAGHRCLLFHQPLHRFVHTETLVGDVFVA